MLAFQILASEITIALIPAAGDVLFLDSSGLLSSLFAVMKPFEDYTVTLNVKPVNVFLTRKSYRGRWIKWTLHNLFKRRGSSLRKYI